MTNKPFYRLINFLNELFRVRVSNFVFFLSLSLSLSLSFSLSLSLSLLFLHFVLFSLVPPYILRKKGVDFRDSAPSPIENFEPNLRSLFGLEV